MLTRRALLAALAAKSTWPFAYSCKGFPNWPLEKAFALWKASHEDDTNAEGTYLLAVAYRDGLGTETDAVEARRLMKQAAEMGNDKAIKAWKEMEEK